MKQVLYLVSLPVFLFLGTSFSHKFYVSINQLEHVPEKKRVEITTRLFIDDLNNALEEEYQKTFYIGTNLEQSGEKDFLENYFFKNVSVKINGKDQKIIFLGYEKEDDVLVCYSMISGVSKVKSIEIYNSLLMNFLKDQQNIIHTSIPGSKKSLLLTYKKKNGVLNF